MLEFNINLPCRADTVWKYITQPMHMAKWWGPNITMEMRKGGAFADEAEESGGKRRVVEGLITTFEDETRLQINWRETEWPDPTRVEFLLTPAGGTTILTLQHSGWDIFKDDTRADQVESYRRRWTELLAQLKIYCQQHKGA